ncbi:MAG: S41 family peptidase [Acidobacteria bacterium]|nr:MAG: S41 family peptidase [Acidobacteriota bacterium]REK01566.1 MAG: S41 family peptidase [Acidobacteriota bacterium]REK14522.1 MAG: S41 family peptidase [Acidobacteriota bacterium]REK45237.1 MAG: S41 family peptidase [Acidobacteriota bacterium]
MKNALYISVLLALVLSGVVPAQEASAQRTDGEEVEPFRISRGQSFSASPGGQGDRGDGVPRYSATQALVDYKEALDVVLRNHVSGNEADPEKLTKLAIETMLSTLDPHSSYFDPREYSELLAEQRSEYFGIGASIANFGYGEDLSTYIVATFEGSPAYVAGLRFGDRIVEVDGLRVVGRNSLIVRNRVRGPIGSEVTIVVERAGVDKRLTYKLRRKRVPQPSIPDHYMLDETVGYVDLSAGFNYTTKDELDRALSDLARSGMRSLILDLRDNTGGILEQAVHVAGKFLPRGSRILSQRGRSPFDNRDWDSGTKTPVGIPLIVLVNEETASASEIVAGALQDHDRALIVGTRTFGKGLVQSVIDLPHGAGMTLTSAKYYTPSGRLIQRDYSNVGLYDYYRHKSIITESQDQKHKKETAGGRTVFGGDGIRPDQTVEAFELNERRLSLLDPLFFFSRDLSAGQISGLDSYRVFRQTSYSGSGSDREFLISPEVLNAFKDYVSTVRPEGVTEALLVEEESFIKARLRYNLYVAAYGTESGKRILNDTDPQVRVALDLLPKARQMASKKVAAQK